MSESNLLNIPSTTNAQDRPIADAKDAMPVDGRYYGFDHLTFWVGNAKQAASFYVTRFGMRRIAYQGLETGNRHVVSHVVQKNKIFFVFQSPLNPDDEDNRVMCHHMKLHGDGVKDVAFNVSDCRSIYKKAMNRGAKSIREPIEVSDEHGTVVMATIATVSELSIFSLSTVGLWQWWS